MGIQGLLQFIKEASEPINVKKYKGQAVAVDTYCWLHKGAIACAEKLAKGEPTDRYVGFCMKFVNMLLSHGVKPILVFDGCTLPSKKEVERSRRERRQTNLLKGKQLLREGKVSEARECFTRCVNITHAMAHKVIKAARAQGVDCLVAPYEADAQLAYLNKAGIVQAVITEDSDLLAFGCKKVILKMDQFGNGLEIDQARLGMCKQLGDVFTEEKFRYMCILSGCDYLSSLRGIGLAKACKVLRLANNPDIVKVIKKIGHYLKMNITVPEDYIKGFIRANNTFLYQLVFDPIKRKLVPLNAYEDDVDPDTLSYAGQYLDDSTALQIALGNRDINTDEQIDDYDPDTARLAPSRSHSWNDKTCPKSSAASSIWHRSYCPGLDLDAVSRAAQLKENPSTVGIKQVINEKRLNLPRKFAMVKRPRSEELSEDDLLNQYSLSFIKKKKTSSGNNQLFAPALDDGTAHVASVSKPPTVRNKFATFLQRKNEDSGAIVVPGTRSRFFCSPLDFADSVVQKTSSQPVVETAVTDEAAHLSESDCPDKEGQKLVNTNAMDRSGDQISGPIKEDQKLVDINSMDRSGDQISGPVEEGQKLVDINAMDRSGDHISGPVEEGQKLVDTNAMERSGDPISGDKTMCAGKETPSCRVSGTTSPPALGTRRNCFSWSGGLGGFSRTPSPSASAVLQQFRRRSQSPSRIRESSMPRACPSDSEEWPRTSPSLSPSPSQDSTQTATLSQPSSKDSDSEESDCNNKSLDSQDDQNSKQHLSQFSKTNSLVRKKVPGLYKYNSWDSLSATKIKPLAPARVSGLSRKPTSIPKRNHHNAENKPELQIKISDLWKNFGFKKDTEKLPSCKKPLSPIKDNIQLTPEAEEEIFNKPECARAQRAIFQ